MVKNGITITYEMAIDTASVTIGTLEHGSVTADKTTAGIGENVILTVTPDSGYELDTLTVNGEKTTVTDGKATVAMAANGLSVSATFTDVLSISSYDSTLQTSIRSSDSAKYRLTCDMTTDIIALSKGITVLDLQGHTLTVTGNTGTDGITSAIDKTAANSEGAYVQDITIKNGTIKYTGTQGSKTYPAIDANSAKKYVFDAITLTAENKLNDGFIKYSTTVTLEIKDSTFTVNAYYVLGSNNLEGTGGKITIEGSTLTTSREDGDCTALLCTVVGANVAIKDSTLTGDRQGVLARTGTWTIEDSTLVTTGKFLTLSDANKQTNTSYINGYWGTGNEVPVAALVAGDTYQASYNESVTLTAKNTILKADGDNAFKLVAREDGGGTYKTNISFDALTYVNSVNSHHIGSTVTLTTSNVISKTIAEANALGADEDAKNIYKVSGILKSIANSQYGNCYIEDKETGKTLYLYGAYTEGTYSKDSSGNFTGNGTTVITDSLIGYSVTAYGIYSPYNGSAQLKNAIVVKGDKVEGLTASISVNNNALGTASLSKTSDIAYGEEITVTATPATGCSVESVVLTDKSGAKTDITKAMKFTATAENTVIVNFINGIVNRAEIFGSNFTENKTIGNQSQTINGFKFEANNAACYPNDSNNPALRLYKSTTSKASTLKISPSDSNNKILKVEITTTNSYAKAGGLSAEVGTYTVDTTNNPTYGVWTSSDGASSVTFKVGTADQVRITKFVIQYTTA